MTEKEYRLGLSKMTARRSNRIADAVNRKIPMEEAGLQNEVERRYYKEVWREAEAHQEKYGDWPVFEMDEIEWEDVPDIYHD